MFALRPVGVTEFDLGQNHRILREKKSILNPDKYSYDKYDRFSILISQTRFVYFIDHFGAKMQNFFNENHELNAYEYKSFEPPISPVGPIG
jgi:hypothetical protein